MGALLAITFTACGGTSSDEEAQQTPMTTTSTTSTTTSVALTPFETWVALSDKHPEVKRENESEVSSVAANLCDNTVGDFNLLIELSKTGVRLGVESNVEGTIASKAIVVAAYCPEKLLQLEEATKQSGLNTAALPVHSGNPG